MTYTNLCTYILLALSQNANDYSRIWKSIQSDKTKLKKQSAGFLNSATTTTLILKLFSLFLICTEARNFQFSFLLFAK